MIKIAICEDEKNQRELIEKYLINILDEIKIQYEILTFNCGEDLFNNYPDNIDIFLLDIQMGKINGMDVARKIRKIDNKNVEIIFTTSLVDYIQEGYEVRAFRYLLKPIKCEDLKKHLISCIKDIKSNKDNYIVINNKTDTYKVNISDITYIEIKKRDMTVYTIKGNYEIKYSLDKIEKELESHNFFRCHKSFLVNINYIENVRQYIAILENKEEIPISRHRFKDVKSKLLSHLGDALC